MRVFSVFKSSSFIKVLSVILVSIIPGVAMAADSWATVFENFSETLNAGKSLLVVAAYLMGTGLAIFGLWLIYKDGKDEGRGHMKNGIISLVIGALLLVFPNTVGWTVGTLGGENSDVETEFDTDFNN